MRRPRRGRIESILDFATSAGYRGGENPARWRGHLANLLPRKSKVAQVKHYQALRYAAIPEFMMSLRQRTGIADRALQFATLTGVRSGEALEAIWDEFDLEAKLWTIPAARMKAKRDHIVPLSDALLAVLEQMRVVRQPGAGFVFPGRPEPAAAQGPMQVTWAAAADVGGGDRFDLAENRALGRAYLARMFRRYGNWPDAVTAYNWGPRNVDTWIGGGRAADGLPLDVERYRSRVLRDAALLIPTELIPAH